MNSFLGSMEHTRSCQVPGDKEEPQLSSQGAARTEDEAEPSPARTRLTPPPVPGRAGVSAEQHVHCCHLHRGLPSPPLPQLDPSLCAHLKAPSEVNGNSSS